MTFLYHIFPPPPNTYNQFHRYTHANSYAQLSPLSCCCMQNVQLGIVIQHGHEKRRRWGHLVTAGHKVGPGLQFKRTASAFHIKGPRSNPWHLQSGLIKIPIWNFREPLPVSRQSGRFCSAFCVSIDNSQWWNRSFSRYPHPRQNRAAKPLLSQLSKGPRRHWRDYWRKVAGGKLLLLLLWLPTQYSIYFYSHSFAIRILMLVFNHFNCFILCC